VGRAQPRSSSSRNFRWILLQPGGRSWVVRQIRGPHGCFHQACGYFNRRRWRDRRTILAGRGLCLQRPIMHKPSIALRQITPSHLLKSQVVPNLDYVPGAVGTPAAAMRALVREPPPMSMRLKGCDQSVELPMCAPQTKIPLTMIETPGFSVTPPGASNASSPGAIPTVRYTQYDNLSLPDPSGPRSPLASLAGNPGNPITSSNSIVSLPIYDQTTALGSGRTPVTFRRFPSGFHQRGRSIRKHQRHRT